MLLVQSYGTKSTLYTTGPKLRLLTYPELPYGLPDSARAAHMACAAGNAAHTRFGERIPATRTRSAAPAKEHPQHEGPQAGRRRKVRGMQNGQVSNLPRLFARSQAKENAKGWRSNVPCCNACSDNAWMHTTPRQLAAAYSIPCGAVLGARVALPATLELLARSN